MSFCPHCHSGVDPVLKDTTWSCGVRFNDALWRTKECYKRQIYVGDEHLRLQEQHISELEKRMGDSSSASSGWRSLAKNSAIVRLALEQSHPVSQALSDARKKR